jgi:hypothetical protein
LAVIRHHQVYHILWLSGRSVVGSSQTDPVAS